MDRRADLALALGATALALALSLTGWLDRAEEAVYDRALPLRATAAPGPVLLVAIDEPSFAEFGDSWPWPRSRHAALIEAIRAGGARAIGLDLVFAEPRPEQGDAALSAALGPDVVLAADRLRIETPQGILSEPVDPMPALLETGARVGQIGLPVDGDGAIRRLPTDPAGFAPLLAGHAAPEGARIRFLPGGVPRVSYYQALRAGTDLPPDIFRDRIVLVGFALRSGTGTTADNFRTPLTATGGGLMPGAEVHAQALRSLVAGDWITPLPRWLTVLLALGLAGAAALPFPVRSARSTAALTTGLALLPPLAAATLLSFGYWLPPVAPMLAALAGGIGRAGLDHGRERRARHEITRIFGQYLAPELVSRLAADPSQVKLGGERRMVTVLFCDLRGFTRLSEALADDPEGLAAILNRALTEIADAVLAHGGMIDKFIGDCVMGLWNAPAEDPEHADHAVEAGLAAVAGIARLSRELEAEGRDVRLACGVGINSGVATVGNLGTTRRFDYTAVGDAVNVASRLEGMTKEAGVPVLIGEATAGMVRRVVLRAVGVGDVRGRSGVVRVFTPDLEA